MMRALRTAHAASLNGIAYQHTPGLSDPRFAAPGEVARFVGAASRLTAWRVRRGGMLMMWLGSWGGRGRWREGWLGLLLVVWVFGVLGSEAEVEGRGGGCGVRGL